LLCYGGVLDADSLPLHTSSSGGCGFGFRVTARHGSGRRRCPPTWLPGGDAVGLESAALVLGIFPRSGLSRGAAKSKEQRSSARRGKRA
jgi:hypothetical protein